MPSSQAQLTAQCWHSPPEVSDRSRLSLASWRRQTAVSSLVMCASLSAAVAIMRRTRAIEANGSLAHTTCTCDPASCQTKRSIETIAGLHQHASGSLTPTRALYSSLCTRATGAHERNRLSQRHIEPSCRLHAPRTLVTPHLARREALRQLRGSISEQVAQPDSDPCAVFQFMHKGNRRS